MLILLPPSESKNQHGRGRPLQLDQLSFPELTQARDQALTALSQVSLAASGREQLGAPVAAADEVSRNAIIRSLPTLPVAQLYSGVLYDALDLASMSGAALRRARRWIVVTSALLGAVRLSDRIPPYRMSIGSDIGVGSLPRFWRPTLSQPLVAAAGRGLVVDCRSGSYRPMWRPTELAQRWVQIQVPGASHFAKHTRGLLARHLCLTGSEATSVPALARELGHSFDVQAHPPTGNQGWRLDVRAH